MAGVKISALPAVPSAALTDILPVVQGAITSKETLQQVVTLFNLNIQIAQSQVTGLLTALSAKLDLAGGTMTGTLVLAGDPATALEAATKQYVDSVAEGLNFQGACVAATTANLAGYTYANGTAGVGATLTAGSNGAFSTDGVSPALNARVLVPFQSSQVQNGIYVLSQVGDGSNPAILTRAGDYNQPSEIDPGDAVIVQSGTLYVGTLWIQTGTVVTIGVSNIIFVLSNSAANIVAGTGLTKTGNTISLIVPVTPATGGTGVNNGTNTMTVGGNFAMSGAFTYTGTVTGNTTVTFPTSGTLATTTQVAGRVNTVTVQTFSATGTYTPTTGMIYCIAEVVGAGGGGGGSTGGVGTGSGGGGGGAGGYVRKLITAAAIGASQAVTIGAGGTAGASPGGNGGNGGTSSLGAIISATGGSGGSGDGTHAIVSSNAGGNAGVGSSGDVNARGGGGVSSLVVSSSNTSGGQGGNSYFGGGGRSSGEADGVTGTLGGGASGGGSFTVNHAGAAGGNGFVVITEFIAT